MILLPLILLLQQETRPKNVVERPPAATLGARVSPETVTVGQRFSLIIRVGAPRGAEVLFPSGPDSGQTVELASGPQMGESRDAAGWTNRLAGYRLAAWDTGQHVFNVSDVVVRADGVERRVAVGALAVYVRSVLPADTSLHKPKPARPLLDAGLPAWLWWLLAALAAIALAWVVWWIRRAWRGRRSRPMPPLETAMRELARVEAMKLPERGEGSRHVALVADVMRDYLAGTFAPVLASHTTSELMAALHRADPPVPHDAARRLQAMLERADLAKFAAVLIPSDEAIAAVPTAKTLLTDVERSREVEQERKAA